MRSKDFPYFLAAPAQRALANAGIQTLDQLAACLEKNIADLHGMGPNAITKLKESLAEHGMSFAEPTQ